MFTFDFYYTDGKNVLIEHVNQATIQYSNGSKIIEAEEILSFSFPINAVISLRSELANCTVSREGLRAIKITKEN